MNKNIKKATSLVSSFLVFIVLTGCAPILSVKKVHPDKPVNLIGNEVPVFGKVIFVEDGEEKTHYSRCRTPTITFLHKDSGWKREYIELEDDGTFYLILPRGRYSITDICLSEYDYCIEPHLMFQMFHYNAFYIGTVKLDVKVKNRWIFGFWIEAIKTMEVSDEFDTAKEAFTERYPGFKGEIVRNLLISDGTFPIAKSRGGPIFP